MQKRDAILHNLVNAEKPVPLVNSYFRFLMLESMLFSMRLVVYKTEKGKASLPASPLPKVKDLL